ncbi:MAG: monovalent cation/H(+) antiporter subunit G [Rhizobiaceae bacterium]
MFATLVEIISWILIVSGGAFSVIGAIGQLRFPDFWARLHAASVSDSAGMILLIAGMILQSGVSLIAAKLIIIGAFLYITGATSTHAVASAALVSGLKPPVLKKTKSSRKSRSKKEQAKT